MQREAEFKKILDTVEPILDQNYGDSYRCSLTLEDGTILPCVTLLSRAARVRLAKRRIVEEMSGKGFLGASDPFGEIVSSFAASVNQIADYVVVAAVKSPYAVPVALLEQIEIETTMGWTGWVFELNDGALHSFGTPFRANFMDIPEGFAFENVRRVHNHSFVDGDGKMRALTQGGDLPEGYDTAAVFGQRVAFECFVDWINPNANVSEGDDIVASGLLVSPRRREGFLVRGLRKLF